MITFTTAWIGMQMRVKVSSLSVDVSQAHDRANRDLYKCIVRTRSLKVIQNLRAKVSDMPFPPSVCMNSALMNPSPSPEFCKIAKWISNMAM